MKTFDFDQTSPEWHEWRSTGIGASEVSVIMGENPYKTRYELWAEKVGIAEAPDLSGNPNVQKGVRLEPLVRSRIEAMIGEDLAVVCAEHDEHPVIKCSFDGLDSHNRPHEIKCPSDGVFAEVEMFGEDADAFKLYKSQVIYQALISGANEGFLYFYNETKDELLSFTIKVTESDEAIIKEALAFWDLVQTNTPPAKDLKRDKLDAKEICDTDLIEQLLASKRCLASAEAQLKEMKADHTELESMFVQQLGDFDKFEDSTFGLKVTKFISKGRVNYTKLLKDEGLETKANKYRSADKEGVRFTYNK